MYPAIMTALLDDISDRVFLVEDLSWRWIISASASSADRYADADIGFVDAAVLAVVERFNEPKLATLDRRHFGMLRPRHVDALILLPA